MTPTGSALVRLPPGAAAHMRSYDAELRARADYAGGPPGPCSGRRGHGPAPRDLAGSRAAVSPRARSPALRDAARVPLNTCYVAPPHGPRRTRSGWRRGSTRPGCGAVARLGAVPAAGGFHRFAAAVVSRLPLPATVLSDLALPAAAKAGRAGEPVQETIDDLAAGHLAFPPASAPRWPVSWPPAPRHRR